MPWITRSYEAAKALLSHEALLWWAGGVSLALFLLGLFGVPLVIINLPSNYFTSSDRDVLPLRGRHLLLRITVFCLKNTAGLLLVGAGIAMLVLPGQGLLSIMVGMLLLDFPGKYHLEQRLISRPGFHRAANWLRAKAERPLLELPLNKHQ